MSRRIFVTGIGTEIGKTFSSAIICEALQADYWKPVQAGELNDLDSLWVRDFISNKITQFHTERYLLSEPISPHAAARLDGIKISLDDFKIPKTDNILVIEGAGGLMVPLNDDGDMMIDLIPRLAEEVVLVTMNYLGSINHTLMSYELLKQRNLNILGIMFNGDPNPETEEVILEYTGLKCLGKIPLADSDIKEFIKEQAELVRINFL